MVFIPWAFLLMDTWSQCLPFLQSAALLGGINALHTAFPHDADQEYLTQADIILHTLKLESLRDSEMKILIARKKRADTTDIVNVSSNYNYTVKTKITRSHHLSPISPYIESVWTLAEVQVC